MLDFETLLHQVKNQTEVIEVSADDKFNFLDRDFAYIIESGSVLVVGERSSETGVSPTHTLEVNDPIGCAEAIAARPPKLKFKQVADLTLRQFKSSDIRKFVDRANVFSKTIIKYSIGRIFGQTRTSSNLAFEEGFIDKNYDLLKTRRVARDEEVFKIGSVAKDMFFINKGLVQVVSKEMKVIAELGVGECFGESALFDFRPRTYGVVASQNSDLLVIDSEQVEIEVSKEPAIVRLAVLLLVKRLEVMNNLRLLQQN